MTENPSSLEDRIVHDELVDYGVYPQVTELETRRVILPPYMWVAVVVILATFAVSYVSVWKAKAEEGNDSGYYTGLVCTEESQIKEIFAAFRVDENADWQSIVNLISQGLTYPACLFGQVVYNGTEMKERVVIKHETFQILALVVYQYGTDQWPLPTVYVFYGAIRLP